MTPTAQRIADCPGLAKLREVRIWYCWRPLEEGRKIPVDENGHKQANYQNQPLTFEEASARDLALPGVGGLGILRSDVIGAVDFDACEDNAIVQMIRRTGCYVERSPSLNGYHAIGVGADWVQVSWKSGEPDPKIDTFGPFLTITAIEPTGSAEVDITKDLADLRDFFKPKAKGKGKAPGVSALPPEGEPVSPGTQNIWLRDRAWMLAHRRDRTGEPLQFEDVLLQLRVDAKRCPPSAAPWTESDLHAIAQRAVLKAKATPLTLSIDQHGKPHPTVDNVRIAFLMLGRRPRWDRFARQYVLEDPDGSREPVDDQHALRLRLLLNEMYKLGVSVATFQDALYDQGAQDSFHPVLEYLGALKWDGKPRVGEWLVTYGNAAPSNYTLAVGRLFLVAAVRRVRHPGCKFDELLVLESEQGFDKSRAISALCPRREWFSETLPLGLDSKQVIERTAGVWIAEAADLVGNKKDVDALKAFLSTSEDGPVRLAYAKEPVRVKRQYIAAGTTNRTQYLRDATGNRRFWPIKVDRMDSSGIERDRDQLWAEAAQLEAAGASIRLAEDLWTVAAAEQEQRHAADPWEEVLAEVFEDHAGKVLSHDVWRELKLSTDRRLPEHKARLGAVMRRLGFKYTNIRDDRSKVRPGYTRGEPPFDWLIIPVGEPPM